AANPANVLALLDELEAKDKQISDLKEAFHIALYAAGINGEG
ncbi:TPA: ead/Ea22-like family protein, partial [Enterobacter hormaechei subsp. xiangfangensis]